jgi:Family of unknown function (DUF6889)
MNDDEDWVMRPALEGICRYESLVDGTLDLGDVARMNEALDVRNENQARVEEAMKDQY